MVINLVTTHTETIFAFLVSSLKKNLLKMDKNYNLSSATMSA